MNRDKIVAGNWKMNNDSSQTKALILELKKAMPTEVNVMIAPSFTNLSTAKGLLLDSKIDVIAQNMHFSDSGAFTGEVSPKMLKSIGIETVILGHSERRKYFNETDDQLKLKVDAAISSSIKIIFCIGEEIEDRKKEEEEAQRKEEQRTNKYNDINNKKQDIVGKINELTKIFDEKNKGVLRKKLNTEL
ncbi:MAG TPA: triose-phosphate isomerase, partial [Flavobacteriaceae bacterium]|nr:triose-phosphate isomerase [Flavobacteriaceae bacterium]